MLLIVLERTSLLLKCKMTTSVQLLLWCNLLVEASCCVSLCLLLVVSLFVCPRQEIQVRTVLGSGSAPMSLREYHGMTTDCFVSVNS